MNTEPVRTLLLPIAAAAFVAAAQAFIAGADVRGVVTAVLGALVLFAQEYARSRVTPVTPQSRSSWGRRGEQGYGLVEAILGLILLIIAVWLLLALVGR